MDIKIREYNKKDELNWLDIHASVMVDSYAWWIVLHTKPTYDNETIDLVAIDNNKIIGFITVEINSKILDELNTGFVWEFGVHRDYRGNNIGYQLIKETHKIMNNKYKINKSIWYSQDEFAQKYYEKLGMKEIDRHWQFSVVLDGKQKEMFTKDGFTPWSVRGSCNVNDFDKIKEKYKVITDDDALNPKICVGYEFVL